MSAPTLLDANSEETGTENRKLTTDQLTHLKLARLPPKSMPSRVYGRIPTIPRFVRDRDDNYFRAVVVDPVTRHTVLPTSSATSNAPLLSIMTPTGRPAASPRAFTKPVSTTTG
jgi:hypothetical protein